MGVIRDFIDFIKDALWITKTCFTSFYFWLPVLLGVYFVFQLWLAMAVHPATLLILPAALSIYMIAIEDKRLAAQYGLKKKGTSGSGAIVWNVKKSVDEYMRILNGRQKIRGEPLPFEEEEEEEKEE